MGIKYFWDTIIAIYYLQKQFSSSAEKFHDLILLTHNTIDFKKVEGLKIIDPHSRSTQK
jgi:hypothetical protein